MTMAIINKPQTNDDYGEQITGTDRVSTTPANLRTAATIQTHRAIARTDAVRMMSGNAGSAPRLLHKTDPIRSEGHR